MNIWRSRKSILGGSLGNLSRTKGEPYNLMQLSLRVIHMESLKAKRTLLAPPVKITPNQEIEEVEDTTTIKLALTSK